MVVQPLETSIVRSIDVHEGEAVHAGQVLARLDPTFAAADLGAQAAQVASLRPQVARMQAEVDDKPFTYSGLDPNLALQAAIYAQRKAEYRLQAGELPAEGRQPGRDRSRAPTRMPPAIATSGGARTASKDAQGAGEAAGRQPAEHPGRDGQAGGDGAQPGQRAAAGRRRASATSPRCWPSATATCSSGTPTSPTSCPTRPASCPMRVSAEQGAACAASWWSCAPTATPPC